MMFVARYLSPAKAASLAAFLNAGETGLGTHVVPRGMWSAVAVPGMSTAILAAVQPMVSLFERTLELDATIAAQDARIADLTAALAAR